MKKLVLLVFCCQALFAQLSRYQPAPATTVSPQYATGQQAPLLTMPGATVAVCGFPAVGLPCSNLVTTYTDVTGEQACPVYAQVTPQTPATLENCSSSTDSEGNFGFWLPSGTYTYTLTFNGLLYGPYAFSIGGGGTSAYVSVPNVVGLATATAITDITNSNLTVGTQTTATSPTVPSGDIISQSPAAGTFVLSGSSVSLVTSVGAAQPYIPYVTPTNAPTAPGGTWLSSLAPVGAPTSPTIVTGAPVIGGWSQSAQPGESVVLTGTGFATGGVTKVWLSDGNTLNQLTPSINTTVAGANYLAVTIPSSLSYNFYVIWVQNSDGVSIPVGVNHTAGDPRLDTHTWIGPKGNKTSVAVPLRVFGRDLSQTHGTSTSYVYVVSSNNTWTQATVTNVEPESVTFTVPSLAYGTYTVYVHNGSGGVYGWSDGATLQITSSFVRGSNVVNLSPSGGDDTSAIQTAINTASSYQNGGTVNLASGTFNVSGNIQIAPNVALVGQGSTGGSQTKISIALNVSTFQSPNIFNLVGSNITVSNIHFYLATSYFTNASSLYPFYTAMDCRSTVTAPSARCSNTLISGVIFDANDPSPVGTWTASTAYSLNQLILDDNFNLQKATTAGTSGSTIPTFNSSLGTTTDGSVTWTEIGTYIQGISANYFSSSEVTNSTFYREFGYTSAQDTWVHGNTFNGGLDYGYAGGDEAAVDFVSNSRCILENNTMQTLNWTAIPTVGANISRRVISGAANQSSMTQIYIGHNTGINVAPNTSENRGELFLFHGEAAPWYGQAISNSGDTVTVATNGLINGVALTNLENYGSSSYSGVLSDPLTQVIPTGTALIVQPTGYGYINIFLYIVGGTGSGQVRRITAVTANTITVSPAFLIPPDSTSLLVLNYVYKDITVYANNIQSFPSSAYSTINNSGASSLIVFDGNCWFNLAEANTGSYIINGSRFGASSQNQSMWNEIRGNTLNPVQRGGLFTIDWTNPSAGSTVQKLGPDIVGNGFHQNNVTLVGPQPVTTPDNAAFALGSNGSDFTGQSATFPFNATIYNLMENNTITGGRAGIYAGGWAYNLYLNNSIALNPSPPEGVGPTNVVLDPESPMTSQQVTANNNFSLIPIIPNVVGESQSAAEAQLISAGFTIGTVTTQHSSTVAAGNVISTSPVAGSAAIAGSAVSLVVSLGP